MSVLTTITLPPGEVKPAFGNCLRRTGPYCDLQLGFITAPGEIAAVGFSFRAEGLLAMAAELERLVDLLRGEHERVEDERDAVEAVADDLRDALAGGMTAPHENVSATGHLEPVSAAGGGC